MKKVSNLLLKTKTSKDNNVIVNDDYFSNQTMSLSMNIKISAREVDNLADKLVLALNNPGARDYYCKLFYKLPQAVVWNNLEQSAKGKDQIKLFTFLCQQSLKGKS